MVGVFGSGELAYGMYAHADEYRLDVFARSAAGARRRIAPTDLTRGVRSSVLPLLAGADHWRLAPRLEELRAALPEGARHACDVERALYPASPAIEIEMILQDRPREGEAIRTTRAVAACALAGGRCGRRPRRACGRGVGEGSPRAVAHGSRHQGRLRDDLRQHADEPRRARRTGPCDTARGRSAEGPGEWSGLPGRPRRGRGLRLLGERRSRPAGTSVRLHGRCDHEGPDRRWHADRSRRGGPRPRRRRCGRDARVLGQPNQERTGARPLARRARRLLSVTAQQHSVSVGGPRGGGCNGRGVPRRRGRDDGGAERVGRRSAWQRGRREDARVDGGHHLVARHSVLRIRK